MHGLKSCYGANIVDLNIDFARLNANDIQKLTYNYAFFIRCILTKSIKIAKSQS